MNSSNFDLSSKLFEAFLILVSFKTVLVLSANEWSYLCPTKIDLLTAKSSSSDEKMPTYESIECNPQLQTIRIEESLDLTRYYDSEYRNLSDNERLVAFMYLNYWTRTMFAGEFFNQDTTFKDSSLAIYHVLKMAPARCLGTFTVKTLRSEKNVQAIAQIIYGLSLQGQHQLASYLRNEGEADNIDTAIDNLSKLPDGVKKIIKLRFNKMLSKKIEDLVSNLGEVAFDEMPAKTKAANICGESKIDKKKIFEAVAVYSLPELKLFFQEIDASCKKSYKKIFGCWSAQTKTFITTIDELSRNHSKYMAKQLYDGMYAKNLSRSDKDFEAYRIVLCRAEIDLADIIRNFNNLTENEQRETKTITKQVEENETLGRAFKAIFLAMLESPKSNWRN